MRSVLLLTAAAMVLAGCEEPYGSSYRYKDRPVTLAQKDRDVFDCHVESAQAIPANNRSYTTPVHTTPLRCIRTGIHLSCTGGETTGGDLVTEDVNEGLRDEYNERCLAGKGYRTHPAPIPICSADQVPRGIDLSYPVYRPVEGACMTTGTRNANLVILPSEMPGFRDPGLLN